MLLEAVVSVAVIFLMLLFVGIPLENILNLFIGILLGGIALTIAFVILFFFGTDLFLLFFKPARGRFVRIDDTGRFDHAVYLVGAREYACIFPAESVGRKRIYQKDEYFLLIPRRGKRLIAYDRHSLIVIVLGNIFSVCLIVFLLVLLKTFPFL
ncbi:MAG: hypothetical protein IJ060_10285 [Oscillospiraceae bacterium]|nr:hypothetical protein [Oscillospiraceae bacterium]